MTTPLLQAWKFCPEFKSYNNSVGVNKILQTFKNSSSNCFGIVNAAYFAYEISNDQWMGAIIEAPQWNSTTNTEAWDRTDHEQYVFAELVP